MNNILTYILLLLSFIYSSNLNIETHKIEIYQPYNFEYSFQVPKFKDL